MKKPALFVQILVLTLFLFVVDKQVEATYDWEELLINLKFNETPNMSRQMNRTESINFIGSRNYSTIQTAQKVTSYYRPIGPVANMSQQSFQSAGTPGDISYLQMGPTVEMYRDSYASWTFECWMRKGTTTDTAATPQGVVGANGGNGLMSAFVYSTMRLNFTFEPPNNSRTYEVNATLLTDANINTTWHHWALTGTDKWLTLVINGTNTSHVDYLDTLGFNESIFSTGNGIQYLGIDNIRLANDWLYDECRYWNTTRSPENISALMFTEIDGPYRGAANYTINVYDEDSEDLITNWNVNDTGGDIWVQGYDDSTYLFNDTIGTATGSLDVFDVPNGRFTFRVGPLQDLGYVARNRIIFPNGSNESVTQNIFLVNTTVSPQLVTVALVDETGLPISNYTIQSQRKLIDFGWQAMEDAITNTEGETIMSFHLSTVPYRFLIRENNTDVQLIDEIKITGTSVTLSIDLLDDPMTLFRRYGTSQPNYTFSNESGNLSWMFIDPANTADYTELTVVRFSADDRSQVCGVNYTGSQSWSNCTLPNETGTTFLSQFCIHWPNSTDAGLQLECYTAEHIVGSKASMGQWGMFIGFVVVFMMMIIGMFMGGAVGSLLMVGISFIFLELAEIMQFGYMIGGATFVLAGLVAYMMRQR